MTDKAIRVRFGPSPTGSLHIGGARTALFNWMFAKRHGGQFILRIEDTDQSRSVVGAIDEIYAGLRWLGLEWDEGPDIGGAFGPYVQSERLSLYQEAVARLVEQGKAYRCYATPEELKRAKEIAQKSKGGKIAGYERIYRFISDEERAKVEAERENFVIRLAMPIEGSTTVYDHIRGKIVFPNEELSDTVLLKSDGFPTYHLAMAVDDHHMQISHVMRSDEWLPSLPMHMVLYEAFGWEAPTFVHLPLMVYNGKKISKRKPPMTDKGEPVPVFVREYAELGYQPEAVVNWLCNMGWSFGEDQEIFPIQEAVERFTLERVSPAPTEMPYSKLAHINGHYLREMPMQDFVKEVRPLLEAEYGQLDEARFSAILPHVKERVNPAKDIVPLIRFLFIPDADFVPPSADDLIQKKQDAATTKNILDRCYTALEALSDFAPETLDTNLRALVEELGLKPRDVFNVLRWATTNQQVSPPLFESLSALGRVETLRRIGLSRDSL